MDANPFDRPDEERIDLPRYVVVGLPADARGVFGTSSATSRSAGWVYQDKEGRLLQTEVGRPEGGSLTEERERAVFNILFPFARAVHGDDFAAYQEEVERATNAIRSGTLGWQEDSILLDGQVKAVEVLDLGNNFWVTVALLPECLLTVSSHGVPRGHLELARIG